MRRQQGLTLIELLVAVALTAVVAALAYQGLSQVIAAHDGGAAQLRQLAERERALALLGRDLRQLIDRPVDHGNGDREAALIAPGYGDPLLVLTRTGWFNPGDQLRSELQRVRYRLVDGTLWREYWWHLDQPEREPDVRQALLSGIDSLRLRWYRAEQNGGSWVDQWQGQTTLPRAVELLIEWPLEQGDPITLRRVYELPD